MNLQHTHTPLRVFISYAWEDDEYRHWVAQLASQLRKDGVNARLDHWHLQEGQTIPEFMNSEVRQADKVLVLCSPKYRQKVHAMEDGGPSTGSGWESMLLGSAMFTQDARAKVITALAQGQWKESAPDYIKALPYDNLTHADQIQLHQAYLSLLRRLTENTENAPPVKLDFSIKAPDSATPLFAGHNLDTLATDRGTLPPVVTLPNPHRMPHRSLSGRFAGRVDALWELHKLLYQDGTAVVEGVGVVMGTGGLGKSQLATEYVHRFGNYYPGGVFWTDADQGLPVVVQQIAESVDIDIDGAMPIDKQCEALWRSLGQAPNPILIVYDNFPEIQPLRHWLPVGANLNVLVTTRRTDLTYPKVSLSFMTHDEGLELLNSGDRVFGNESIPLIDALGGLPLALELVCNFLNLRKTLQIDALLVEITRHGEMTALDELTKHYKDELPTGHEKAIGATFQLSWDLASESEQTMLRIMACWASLPIPKRLLRHTIVETFDSVLTDPVDRDISELERLSLITLDQEYDPQIHQLLRGFIRSQSHKDDNQFQAQAVKAVLSELSRTRKDTDMDALTELEKVLPHGQAVLDTEIAAPEDAINIANYICWHQQQRGRYQLAKDAGQQALSLAKQTYETNHSDIGTCQSYLGLVLKALGDLEGAKTLLKDALALALKSYEPGHPEIANGQSNLALVLQALGDLEGAKTLLSEALSSDQKSFEPGHPNIAISQSNLALVLKDLGDLEGAKTLLEDTLASNLKCYEPGHPEIAIGQSNLAQVLQDLGDLEGAKILLSEALNSAQKNFEPGHPKIAIRQSNLASVLHNLGDLEGAKTLLILAYKIFNNLLGEDHPNTLIVRGNLDIVESEIQHR